MFRGFWPALKAHTTSSLQEAPLRASLCDDLIRCQDPLGLARVARPNSQSPMSAKLATRRSIEALVDTEKGDEGDAPSQGGQGADLTPEEIQPWLTPGATEGG